MVIKLNVNRCNISKVCQLLADENISSSISKTSILLEANQISKKLSTKLWQICNIIEIEYKPDAKLEKQNSFDSNSNNTKKEELEIKYPDVKRGQVYLCDFEEPNGHKIAYKRYCIIVQNDVANQNSSTTVVIPCTTSHEASNPSEYSFYFSENNMTDFSEAHVSPKKNTAIANQLQVIDKSHLFKFLGTLTESFMDEHIQPIIQSVFDIKYKMSSKKLKDISSIQLTLINGKNVEELINTSKHYKNSSNKIKIINNLLEKFGFDITQKGINYLSEAIYEATEVEEFNVTYLTKQISELHNNKITPKEIERLLVARVKENFKLNKSPVKQFIQLCCLILDEEECNDATKN